jgi:hypothetical protein
LKFNFVLTHGNANTSIKPTPNIKCVIDANATCVNLLLIAFVNREIGQTHLCTVRALADADVLKRHGCAVIGRFVHNCMNKPRKSSIRHVSNGL